MQTTPIAVIGLGAMGAATLYQLARRGIPAIGIDRFTPPHTLGSSHGETRITRVAVGEGDELVPFVQRSHAIWRELEADTGEDLFDACGLLLLAPRGARADHHGRTDFLRHTIAVAERHRIAHDILDAPAIAQRFPAFTLAGNEDGYYEPGGGYVRPERCIATQLRRANDLGATVLTGATVRAIERAGTGMRITTDAGPIVADQVAVAAGAWAGKLLGAPFDTTLVPYRQVLHWFPVADPSLFRPRLCPAYIWMHGDGPTDYFYGFPALPGTGEIKVATEQYNDPCDPDTVCRDVAEGDAASLFARHVGTRMRGLRRGPARSSVCFYTVTSDRGFVIDRHPRHDRVLVVAACSGHGFKHSAGIGEAVAQLLVDGRSDIDLRPLRLDRLPRKAGS